MTVGDQARPEPETEPVGGSYWETPDLYGQAEALNSMGAIAAPLLAGFSLAAMVQTLTIKASETRWPNTVLVLFMLAAVFFVATVQATFWARKYSTNPSEIKAWWPDASHPERLKLLRSEQKWHAAGFRMWSNRARITYDVALLCLLAALTIVAVPPESHGEVPVLRWLAVAIGGAAFIAEIIWITGSFTNTKWIVQLLEPRPDDTVDTSSADCER
jgi:hypothetical protein